MRKEIEALEDNIVSWPDRLNDQAWLKIGKISYWWFFRNAISFVGFRLPFSHSKKYKQLILENGCYSVIEKTIRKIGFKLLKSYLLLVIFYFRFHKASTWQQPKKNKKRILLLTHEDQIKVNKGKIRSIFRADDIYAQLKKDKKIEIVVFVAKPITKPFINIPSSKELYILEDYLNNEKVKEAMQRASFIHQAWQQIPDKKKIFIWKGKSYFDIIQEEMEFIFSKELISIYLIYYYLFLEIVQKFDLLFLITGIREKIAEAAAYDLNVPVVVLQHGVFSERFYDFLPNTYHTVFGDIDKEILFQMGHDPNKIVVTGPTVMDYINEYKRNINYKKNNNQILILTQPFVEDNKIQKEDYNSIIKDLVESLAALEIEIKIKLHPREKRYSDYKTITKNNSFVSIIKSPLYKTNQKFLFDLISQSALTITFGSTAALDSLLLDVPVIIYKIEKYVTLYTEFEKCGSVALVENVPQTLAAAMKMLGEKKSKSFRQLVRKDAKRLCYKMDGKSAERVAALIQKIIKGEKNV